MFFPLVFTCMFDLMNHFPCRYSCSAWQLYF